MPNMSYCRFQNTVHDVQDCVWAVEDNVTFAEMKLSRDERAAMDRMADLCREFIEQYERMEQHSEQDQSTQPELES